MKKLILAVLLFLFIAQSAYTRETTIDNSKNYGITIYPLSLILTRLSVDFQIGMGNGTLVPYFGTFFGFKVGDLELSNTDFEVSYRFMLAGPEKRHLRFEGFYVAPLVGYSTYSLKVKSSYTQEEVSLSASGFYGGFDLGYQFVWGNFLMNINTGSAYNSLSSDLKAKDSQGHDVKFDVGSFSGFGWRGIGFGLGFMF